jgi:ATP-dependent helicase/nuclease subunit B
MKLYTIPSSANFAETLANGLVARIGSDPLALSRATIYLPTRRAARSFGDAFARVLGGAALLPSFRPLGDVDEDELLLDGSAEEFALEPAMPRERRRLILAALIRQWRATRGEETLSFLQSTAMADSLGSLLDEVETQGADLDKLHDLVPGALAEHWAEVRDFLAILKTQWPQQLDAHRMMNAAERRNRAIARLSQRLKEARPERPVIAAGSTGSIPATADLIAAIAQLPDGAVVLPGLDRDLDKESWARIADDPGHPQFGLRQLLARLGAERDDVEDWQAVPPSPRESLLRETLRPAPTTDAWRALAETGADDMKKGIAGLSLVEAADPTEEARTIALLLRRALETKDKTAALVTPDRALARRVSAEFGRFAVEIDDSAGRPLADTAAGAFLCLLADAADQKFAPVPLLALIKHPLAAMGMDPADFRAHARRLDLALRGPRPDAGLDGIARRIPENESAFAKWWNAVARLLRPLERMVAEKEADLGALLAAHVEAAEALALDGKREQALWRGDSGTAAAELIAKLLDAADGVPRIETSAYAPFFRMSTEEVSVRPPYNRHPRLAILGPLEARLQRFDLVVLGGLNEGRWPRQAEPDPWLSRPMRKAIGLEAPERAIGLSAHDFATLAAAPEVVLTRALKNEGTPTVASRWLQRLKQLARGLAIEPALETSNDVLAVARALAEPGPVKRIERPAPKPPRVARPRTLSFTEIETWLRDPYAIYAKRVLGLEKLDPLDAVVGPPDRGSAIHKALEIFLEDFPDELPEKATEALLRIATEAFLERSVPPATRALWEPRFFYAAVAFVREERLRRAQIARSIVEVRGTLTLGEGEEAWTLRGRADRIDLMKDGTAIVIDYKTGAPPTDKQVKTLVSPQLPLEAAMLQAGGFEGLGRIRPSGLLYVRIGGSKAPADFRLVDVDASDIAAEALARLSARIAIFDDEETPYRPRVMPYRTDSVGDYDHLARVKEWLAAELEEETPGES